MPAFFSHYRFGFNCYKDMPKNIIKQSIKNHPHVFSLGCQGPDLFFYHLGNYSGKENNYAGRLHEENTGSFLNLLVGKAINAKIEAGNADNNMESSIQTAYAAGFLAHYCLDCMVHPYVYSMVGTEKGKYYTGKHFEFESDMDLQFLKKTENKKPSDYDASMIVSLDLPEQKVIAGQLASCVTKSLRGVHLSVSKCAVILKEMEVILALLKDDRGHKGKAGSWTELKLFGYPFASPLFYNDIGHGNNDACNEKKQLWLNPFSNELTDKSVYELFDAAKTEYLKIIGLFGAAFDDESCKGRLSKVIGNRSYKTGMEIVK